ncbi:type IV toxin-antitoxin system AbiEi family antitoxin [Nocardia fluminea]|uniref:type IV toxin-antitoxin system AbiEi family antitoxin n=1 Tax=Nocardia fluminea TaxID=134984 RepID=UPI0036663413
MGRQLHVEGHWEDRHRERDGGDLAAAQHDQREHARPQQHQVVVPRDGREQQGCGEYRPQSGAARVDAVAVAPTPPQRACQHR